MENKTINTHSLISCDAYGVNQVFLIADRTQCRKEPAISIKSLANITGSRVVFEEVWTLEYIIDTFDGSRPMSVIVACWLQTVEAVSPISFQVEFDVKMWISVLSINPPAFSCYLDHCGLALGDCLGVRPACALALNRAFGRDLCLCFGVDVRREDTGHFAGIFSCKLKGVSLSGVMLVVTDIAVQLFCTYTSPEFVYIRLRRLFLGLRPRRCSC